MLLPWMSRSGPSLALSRATASAGSPTRRWLLFHVSGRSDDRRLKIIPNGFGEKPVLKLMFGALVRAAERWRGLRFTEFELRQIAAVRKDLDTVGGIAFPPVFAARPDSPTARRAEAIAPPDNRPGGCCEPPASLGKHIANPIGFMPQSATKHVFRLNETFRLRLQGRRNHLATKRFFNPPSETPVQGD